MHENVIIYAAEELAKKDKQIIELQKEIKAYEGHLTPIDILVNALRNLNRDEMRELCYTIADRCGLLVKSK
tara:strand:- start:90170 stop:90382 length:213 start_codon:yes stop_codon:yes gene_type:complete